MNWIKSSIVVVVSFALAIIFSECLLIFFAPQNLSSSWRVKDKTGLMLNKSVGTSVHQHGERIVEYSFKPIGIRDHKKPPGNSTSLKVLVLGDSFTFGWLLDDEHTYVALLDAHFDNLDLINAAAGGWGAADYTKYVENYCTKIGPSKILVFINADDIGRMLQSGLYEFDPQSKHVDVTEYTPNTKDKVKALLNSLPLYEFLLSHSHLIQLARNAYVGTIVLSADDSGVTANYPFQFGSYETQLNDGDLFIFADQIFERLAKNAGKCGADVIAVYTGVEVENEHNPTLKYLDYAVNNGVFENLGIQFYNLSETVHMSTFRHSNDVTIAGDRHPNENGAELIYKAVVESNSLNRM